jgi:hypothetical protein
MCWRGLDRSHSCRWWGELVTAHFLVPVHTQIAMLVDAVRLVMAM